MLLREIKTIFHDELTLKYPKEEIDSFFYWLISHYLGLEKFVLVLQPDYVVSKEQQQPLFEGLAALKKGQPIQYITGETEFSGLPISINSSVLIPRPETEELVDWILDDYKNNTEELKVLDLGTGSGAIAVALASKLANSEVFAMDISDKAIELAIKNAEKNKVSVIFKKEDIFKLPFRAATDYHIIVSNPPYVKMSEKALMHQNVLEYEPHLALFVPDKDPLKFYRPIVKYAQESLLLNGALYLEINEKEGKDIAELMEENGFNAIEIRKDIFGKDRMVKGVI